MYTYTHIYIYKYTHDSCKGPPQLKTLNPSPKTKSKPITLRRSFLEGLNLPQGLKARLQGSGFNVLRWFKFVYDLQGLERSKSVGALGFFGI